jgi:Uma2 family endonuclease
MEEPIKDKILFSREPEVFYGHHYTYADYLKIPFEGAMELIKGKIFKMSPSPSPYHQEVSGRIFTMISNYLWKQPCKVFSAPFDVILPKTNQDVMRSDVVLQPDICVICDLDLIKERGCFGPPDWVIEILSPSTTKRDFQDKFEIYESSGVKEYWIVEPLNQTVEVFVLENNKYHRITTYVKDDIVPCITLPELTINLEEVFVN